MANIKRIEGKKGVTYQITVFSGRDSGGKQVRHYKTYIPEDGMTPAKIKKEVERVANEFENEIKLGFAVDNKQTFEKYAAYVLELKERNGTKHRTIFRYKLLLDRINPAIGHIKLVELRPQHLNNFYRQLDQDGMNKLTGGKLSKKTILEHHRLISTIMSQAEKEMLIPFNPAKRATPPKFEKKEVNSFQIKDIERIRDCLELEPIKWKTATHLLLITGCRRGEIMGLKWNKIDWDNHQIKIDNNLLYAADIGIYEDSTKTSSSNRFIKLPEETMQLLKEYETWYNEQRINCGDRWVDSNYLFVQENGSPMHPDSLTDWLSKFSKRRDLPHINPHAFRHTHASILYYKGMDSVSISKRLGHAKVSTTTDIYAHFIKEAEEMTSECIADVILRSTDKK